MSVLVANPNFDAEKMRQQNVRNLKKLKKPLNKTGEFHNLKKSKTSLDPSRELTNLYVDYVEVSHHDKMSKLLQTGETLADTISLARQVALDLKAAKKKDNFNFEEFRPKAEAFDAFLREAKERYPGYFKHIESPFGSDISQVEPEKFLSNIEETIERMHELIAYAQGKIPLTTFEMEAAQKMYLLITEILIGSLKEATLARRAQVRNQPCR